MTRTLNKAMLIGNVGKDPDKSVTSNGTPMATFRLATSLSWRDREGVSHEQTDWHTIVAWRALSDVVERFVRKGARVYVEGRITARSYTDKEGRRHTITEIHAEDIILLDARRDVQPKPDGQRTDAPNTNTDDIPF